MTDPGRKIANLKVLLGISEGCIVIGALFLVFSPLLIPSTTQPGFFFVGLALTLAGASVAFVSQLLLNREQRKEAWSWTS